MILLAVLTTILLAVRRLVAGGATRRTRDPQAVAAVPPGVPAQVGDRSARMY